MTTSPAVNSAAVAGLAVKTTADLAGRATEAFRLAVIVNTADAWRNAATRAAVAAHAAAEAAAAWRGAAEEAGKAALAADDALAEALAQDNA